MIHSDLVNFRLELSAEAQQAAELLLEHHSNRAAINRMYFSIYYKVLALADKKNFQLVEYQQLKDWLESHIVDKMNFFESDVLAFAQVYKQAYELDYMDYTDVTNEIAAGFMTKTNMVLSRLERIINIQLDENQEFEATEIVGAAKILVPWDFTPIAEYALEHAIQYAEITGGFITLLHLVKKDKDVPEALQKLNEVATNVKLKFNKVSEVIVKSGSIFESINEIASELDAQMVIMGTHGITGFQKFTGSKALKVIAGTQIPFVVIQDKPKNQHIKNVILPIDDRKEIRQKMNQVRFLSKFFDVKFHLCVPSANLVDGVKKRLQNNVNFVQSFMKQYKINYEVHEFKELKDIVTAVNILIEQIKPDLILTITTKDISASDYLSGTDEQKIIANNFKIPVMCISPIKAKGYRFNSASS
jgi:nucleotide-binding universal stress UspA family protein/uncharacterized protein (UPF0332 family)